MATKTAFDVLDILHPVIDVSDVTSLINGGIYRFRKPENSELRDIVLIPLPIDNEDALHNGYINVNIYAPNHDNGMTDETNLKAITDAVIAKIDAYSQTSTFFFMRVDTQLLLPDTNQPKMSYMNLRVRVHLQH